MAGENGKSQKGSDSVEDRLERIEESLSKLSGIIAHTDNNVQQMTGLITNYVDIVKSDLSTINGRLDNLEAEKNKAKNGSGNGNGAHEHN